MNNEQKSFEEFLNTLPSSAKQNILDSASRGDSITRKAFAWAWRDSQDSCQDSDYHQE